MDEERRLRSSWVANAPAWSAAVRGGTIPSRRAGTDAAIVAALTAIRPGRVLDVGCGEGWLARALASHGHQVVGIDGSAPLIDAARALGGGEFHVVDYARLGEEAGPAGPGPYDAIVCNFSLLGADLSDMLRQLGRLLAPDAPLLVQTVHPFAAVGDGPYRDGWHEEHFTGFGGAFRVPMPWYFRTIAGWVRLLESAGFAIAALEEPIDPTSGRPLSLLLTARSRTA